MRWSSSRGKRLDTLQLGSEEMRLIDNLKERERQGKGVLAANFYNLETLKAILQAAQRCGDPVILQLTESSIDYMGLSMAAGMARQGLDSFGVDGWLHLDHGGSVELAQRALDAGFDSVMIDSSEKPFEENVSAARRVKRLAEPYGAMVEAELGYVAKLGQSSDFEGFTQPEEARRFVEDTGIDALAVAIGTAHGFYKSEPKLRLDLLESIRAVTDCALVLHGSSGISSVSLVAAIKRGISKVNLATEIKNRFMETLKRSLRQSDEIDLRKVFPEAIEETADLVSAKFAIMNGFAEKPAEV